MMRSPMTNSPSVLANLTISAGAGAAVCSVYAAERLPPYSKDSQPRSRDRSAWMRFIQAASLLSPALLLILYLLDPRPEVLLYGFLLPNALSIVGTTLFAWILSKAGPKFNGAIWKGALFFWLFITTWSCIHLIGLFKRTGEWKEIRHTQHADRRLSPAEPAKKGLKPEERGRSPNRLFK